jgi:hypothetical protein
LNTQTQAGSPGGAWGLAGPFIVGLWCAIDHVRTLADSHASAGERANAGLSLAGLIPAVRLDEIGASILGRFGGAGRMALDNFASGGLKGLENGINSFGKQIAETQNKIDDALANGGPAAGRYVSLLEREMNAFQKHVDALKALNQTLRTRRMKPLSRAGRRFVTRSACSNDARRSVQLNVA